MSLIDALDVPLSVPVMAAPMFIASGPNLVSAQCQSGVVGSFPTLNARTTEQLEEWLDQIESSNSAFAAASPQAKLGPLAVNLIVHRTNARLDADLAAVVAHRVPVVVTSLGAQEAVNEAVHDYGGIVLHDVTTNRFAHKAIEKGADGLVAVAAGAGGHAGTQSPFALLQEIRSWFDGPVLLSGAIGTGSAIAGAIAAGADLAYVGSAFLGTEEANVSDDYHRLLLDSTAQDVIYTDLFTGIPANYLRGSIAAVGLDPSALPAGTPGVPAELTYEGRTIKAWRDIRGAGQGVGSTTEITTVETLINRLSCEFHSAGAAFIERFEGRASGA